MKMNCHILKVSKLSRAFNVFAQLSKVFLCRQTGFFATVILHVLKNCSKEANVNLLSAETL